MRYRLQYIEEPSLYYERLWKIPRASIKDLIRIYNLNKDIWKYKSFSKWLNDCYHKKISYKQWIRFVRYYKNYRRRKNLKLSNEVKINWKE